MTDKSGANNHKAEWVAVSDALPSRPGWYVGLNYGHVEPLRFDGTNWHHTRVTRDIAMPSHWASFDSIPRPGAAAPAASEATINSDGIDSKLIDAASEGEDGAVAWVVNSGMFGHYLACPDPNKLPEGTKLYTRPAAQAADDQSASPKHDEGRDLLPCPFCGCPDVDVGHQGDSPRHHFVNCVDCLASTNVLAPSGGTEANAIDAWNRRSDALPIQPAGVPKPGSLVWNLSTRIGDLTAENTRLRALATQLAARRVTDEDYETAVAAQKAMTPHDELMALAGKWAKQSENAYTELRREAFEECADDLRALLDSDAFRAMARNDARYRWLRENCRPMEGGSNEPHALIRICIGEVRGGIGWFDLIGPKRHVGIIDLDAAIDAAASGAREGK